MYDTGASIASQVSSDNEIQYDAGAIIASWASGDAGVELISAPALQE